MRNLVAIKLDGSFIRRLVALAVMVSALSMLSVASMPVSRTLPQSVSRNAEFEFKNIGTEVNPKATVWLVVGKKRTRIMTVAGTPVTESLISDISWIPRCSVTALSSWWAGGGDQMYVLRKGHSFRVYHRPLDEQSKTGKFKLVKTVKG